MISPPRTKPEKEAAQAQSRAILSVSWQNGSFEAKNGTGAPRDLKLWLKGDSHVGENGKATVVFYTAENAVRGNSSRRSTSSQTRSFGKKASNTSGAAAKPTPAALASRKIYENTFDTVKNRQACIYSHFVNMVRIDVSEVGNDEDAVLNNVTTPVMAFYKGDGSYAGHYTARTITDRAFCQGVTRLLKEQQVDARGLGTSCLQAISKLERLVEKKYKLDVLIAANRAKIEEKARKQRSTSTTPRKSTLEKNTEKQEDQSAALGEQIDDLKAEIAEMMESLVAA